MANWSIQFLFEVGKAGFSETYFVDATDMTFARNLALSLLPLRLKLSATAGDPQLALKFVGMRVQNVANPLELLVEIFEAFGTHAGTGSDMPWTGALARMTSVNNRKRMFTLRGLPDNVVFGNYADNNFPTVWKQDFKAFKDFMVASSWRMQVLDKTGGNALKTIAAVAVNDAGELLVSTTAPHGLADNDLIQFYRVKSNACMKGRHRIEVVTATQFRVAVFNVKNPGFVSGKLRKVIYVYESIFNMALQRKSSRKPGRPFFLLRGRSSPKCK